jgi:hypothetical protein
MTFQFVNINKKLQGKRYLPATKKHFILKDRVYNGNNTIFSHPSEITFPKKDVYKSLYLEFQIRISLDEYIEK